MAGGGERSQATSDKGMIKNNLSVVAKMALCYSKRDSLC